MEGDRWDLVEGDKWDLVEGDKWKVEKPEASQFVPLSTSRLIQHEVAKADGVKKSSLVKRG